MTKLKEEDICFAPYPTPDSKESSAHVICAQCLTPLTRKMKIPEGPVKVRFFLDEGQGVEHTVLYAWRFSKTGFTKDDPDEERLHTIWDKAEDAHRRSVRCALAALDLNLWKPPWVNAED